MRKVIIFLSVFTLFLGSCKQSETKEQRETTADTQTCMTDGVVQSDNAYYLRSYFVDSTQIGKKGHNKVEISMYANSFNDDCFVRIFFYSKGKYNKVRETDWWFCNSFIFDDCSMALLPEVSDFNNDGYNDFTYHSLDGARGGNDTRKLFIYKPEKDEFTYIKNSEDYPNLEYNKNLDCITSYIFTGTQDEYFLRLENDSLFEVAHIEILEDSIFVYEYTGKEVINSNKRFDELPHENRNKKLIERRKNTFSDCPFFTNYKPLTTAKK